MEESKASYYMLYNQTISVMWKKITEGQEFSWSGLKIKDSI